MWLDNFANYFSYYDVSDDVQFGYYNAVTDYATSLQQKGLLKKEKQFLKKCGDTNSLPSRPEYRKRLKKLIKETLWLFIFQIMSIESNL